MDINLLKVIYCNSVVLVVSVMCLHLSEVKYAVEQVASLQLKMSLIPAKCHILSVSI